MEGPIPSQFTTGQLHPPDLFQPPHPALVSQPDIGLDAFHFDPQLEDQTELNLQGRQPFEGPPFDSRTAQQARFHEIRPNGSVSIADNGGFTYGHPTRTPRQKENVQYPGGQMYGILTPQTQLVGHPQSHSEALSRLQNEIDLRPPRVPDENATGGHFQNMKMIPNPPNLDEWRHRLFHVDDMITMTEEE